MPITIILVGAQPVAHADTLATQIAADRGAKFLSPGGLTDWHAVNEVLVSSSTPNDAVFVVSTATPESAVQRFVDSPGIKLEFEDAGSAEGAKPGSVNNYRCSVRRAQEMLGLRLRTPGPVRANARPRRSTEHVVYELLGADGSVHYVGCTNDVSGRMSSHAGRVNEVLGAGDVNHHRRALYIKLAESFGRPIDPPTEGSFYRIAKTFINRVDAEDFEKSRIPELVAAGQLLFNKAHHPSPIDHTTWPRLVPSMTDMTDETLSKLKSVGLTGLTKRLQDLSVAKLGPDTSVAQAFNLGLETRRFCTVVVQYDGTTYVYGASPADFRKMLADYTSKI